MNRTLKQIFLSAAAVALIASAAPNVSYAQTPTGGETKPPPLHDGGAGLSAAYVACFQYAKDTRKKDGEICLQRYNACRTSVFGGPLTYADIFADWLIGWGDCEQRLEQCLDAADKKREMLVRNCDPLLNLIRRHGLL